MIWWEILGERLQHGPSPRTPYKPTAHFRRGRSQGLWLEPPDLPVVSKAGAAGSVEPATGQPAFAHSVETAGAKLCSPPLPEGHFAKWLTHILPLRSHKTPEAGAIAATFLTEEETKSHLWLPVMQGRAKPRTHFSP